MPFLSAHKVCKSLAGTLFFVVHFVYHHSAGSPIHVLLPSPNLAVTPPHGVL